MGQSPKKSVRFSNKLQPPAVLNTKERLLNQSAFIKVAVDHKDEPPLRKLLIEKRASSASLKERLESPTRKIVPPSPRELTDGTLPSIAKSEPTSALKITQFEFAKSRTIESQTTEATTAVKPLGNLDPVIHKHRISDIVQPTNTTELPNINWQASLLYKTKF